MRVQRKLRFESTVIGKVIKNAEPSAGYPVETLPVVEDCYRAYMTFVKERFSEELDSLNQSPMSPSRCSSHASARQAMVTSNDS